MRFFSGGMGSNNGGKKKITAGERFRQSQIDEKRKAAGVSTEKTADEKYKAVIEAKMAKMIEDGLMGKKQAGGFKMPGTKEGPPKEVSKNAKLMIKLLAMQRLRKEEKAEKKKMKEAMWKMRAEKRSKAMLKAQKDADEAYQKRLEEEAAAAAAAAAAEAAAAASSSSSSSWWGVGTSSSDDKGGGWW